MKHGKNKSLTKKHHHSVHDPYNLYETNKPEIKITPQKANIQLHQNSPPKENSKWETVMNKKLKNYAFKGSQDIEISKEKKTDSYKMDNTY